MKKCILPLVLILICSIAYAGSSGFKSSGSSFKSSGSSSFKSSSSSTNSSSGFKSSTFKSPSTTSSSGGFKSTGSKTDSALNKSSGIAGKTYTTRQSAVSSFKQSAKTDPEIQKTLNTSHPTTFSKEPPSRPSYIPSTYNNQSVIFHNGGYGYYNNGSWNPLMTYMLLDHISDAHITSSMNQHGYMVSQTNPVFGLILFCITAITIGFVIYAINHA